MPSTLYTIQITSATLLSDCHPLSLLYKLRLLHCYVNAIHYLYYTDYVCYIVIHYCPLFLLYRLRLLHCYSLLSTISTIQITSATLIFTTVHYFYYTDYVSYIVIHYCPLFLLYRLRLLHCYLNAIHYLYYTDYVCYLIFTTVHYVFIKLSLYPSIPTS